MKNVFCTSSCGSLFIFLSSSLPFFLLNAFERFIQMRAKEVEAATDILDFSQSISSLRQQSIISRTRNTKLSFAVS
jgi:hypothetical protein